jgi:hypothetical protein
MRVLLHLHIANSLLNFFDTSFAVRRNYCCLLYRAEYKHSGFAVGKFGKCEEDSGNRGWGMLEKHWLENQSYFVCSFAKLPLTTNPPHPALPLIPHKNSSNL